MHQHSAELTGEWKRIRAFLLIGCAWLGPLLLHLSITLQPAWEIVAIGVTCQWFALWHGRGDPLQPSILLGGVLLLLYIWTTATAHLIGVPTTPLSGYGRSDVAWTLALIAAAFNFLILGCFFGRRASRLPRIGGETRAREAVAGSAGLGTALVLAATIISASVVVLIMGGGLSSYLDKYFQVRLRSSGWTHLLDVVAAPAVHVATALVWYRWLMEGRARRFVPGVAVVLLAAAVTAFLISRMAFVVTGLTLVLIYHYCWNRISVGGLIVIAATATVVLSVWGLYRELTLTGRVLSLSMHLQAAAGLFLSGFDHFDTLVHTIGGLRSGQLDLQFGKPWLNAFLPLPRSILEWKPPTSSQYLGVQLFGLGDQSAAFWRAASLLPDLYVNLDVPGVLAGAGGLGWLAARLYSWSDAHAIARVSYCVLLPYCIRAIRDEFALAVRWAFVALLFLWALLVIGSWLAQFFGPSDRQQPSTASLRNPIG